jgi:hypothetical protein
MAIESVSELFDARTGAWTTDSGRSYNRVFRVLTNNPFDGPNVAIQACGINRGDQYLPTGSDLNLEADTNAYAHTLTATQEDGDSLGWLVTVEYGPYSTLFAGGGPTQNPLLQPIDVKWSMRSQEIVVDIDINGNPILNTAFDPFDPPLMEDDPRPVLTVTRNESTWNQALQIQYRKAINSDPFAGYQPLMSKVLDISADSIFHQDVGWYYQATYQFEFMPPTSQTTGINGYRRTVLNQGMRALSAVNGNKFHPSYKGVPITEPVLLTKMGTVINNGQSPFYLIFQTKPELPFAAFQFDPAALTGQRTGFASGFGPPFFQGQS